MPCAVQVAVHQVGSSSFIGLFAGGIDNLHRNIFNWSEADRALYGGIVGIEGGYRTSLAQQERLGIGLLFLAAVQRVQDGGS